MITKTVLITMLVFSATVSPVHQNPVSAPLASPTFPAELMNAPVKSLDPSLIAYSIKPSDIVKISHAAINKIRAIHKKPAQSPQRARVTIERGRSYDECMRRSFEVLCKNVNSAVSAIEKPEPTPIEIIE